ncbi:MAG: metallophosphoesterase [Bryobacteraceae bacterium]|nr:metallophosphoesterase [Bryobacteraceae bacterium]
MRSRLAAALLCFAACSFAQSERFVFAVIADPQVGWKQEELDRQQFARVVAAVNGLKEDSRPDFVLLAGDLVNDPKSAAQWEAMDAIRRTLKVPFYSVPGNHDPKPDGASGRFSFVHKGCLFLGMDSNLWSSGAQDSAQEQFAWLEGQLRARNRPRLAFVIQHHPLYLHHPEEKDEYFNIPLAWRTRLLKLFEAEQVTAHLAGHLHRNTTGWHRGMAMLVTPSSLYNFDSTPPGFRLIEVHSSGFNETYVVVPVRP